MNIIIAIDGPAGSGKGTLAKALSQKLNLVNIDTGLCEIVSIYTSASYVYRCI